MSDEPKPQTQSVVRAFCMSVAIGIGASLGVWSGDLGWEHKTPPGILMKTFAIGFATSAAISGIRWMVNEDREKRRIT